MGLDAVEIVMRVEEAFDIQLEDSEAEKVLTPRQLIDLVLSKLSLAQADGCLTHKAFNLLRGFCVHTWAIERNRVQPKVALADLLPRHQRRRFFEALRQSLTIAPPHLRRPRWLVALLIVSAVLAGLAVALLSVRLGVNSWVPALMTVPVVGYFGARATNHLRNEFPEGMVTVGDLSRWGMSCKPDLAVASTTAWTREQVAARIQIIVVEQLGCEAAYGEDARFIEDLGLG